MGREASSHTKRICPGCGFKGVIMISSIFKEHIEGKFDCYELVTYHHDDGSSCNVEILVKK